MQSATAYAPENRVRGLTPPRPRRVGRTAPQPTDAPRKNRPCRPWSRRGAVLRQNDRRKLDQCPETSFNPFRQAANNAFQNNPYRPFPYAIFPFSVLRGTRIHTEFAATINATGGLYSAEVSYKDGLVVPYGTAGSVRADGVYGPIISPDYVVELKSGFAVPTLSEIEAYRRNIPSGAGVCAVVEAPGPG